MRRVILFLILFGFSQVSFSATFDQAWSACQSDTGVKIGSWCQDFPLAVKSRYITSSGTETTYASHPYTDSQCPTGQHLQDSLHNICVCDSPNVKDPSTGQCVPPVTCPDGSTAPTLSQCPTSVTCPDGSHAATLSQCPANCTRPQYNLNGTCTNPPDCNSSVSCGYFFDYSVKSCVQNPSCTACSKPNTFYCSPISDCKPLGYVCSNDPATTTAAAAERAANFAAAKSKADAAAAKADAAAAEAQKSADAKKQEQARLDALKEAAKAALDATQANPSSTDSNLQDSVNALSNALAGTAASKAKADNSQNSANQAAQHAANAHNYDSAVPGSATSGHAADNADNADSEATAAENSKNDAIAGDGLGSGQNVEATDGAKEATLEKVLGQLTGHSTPGTYSPGTANGGSSEKGNLNGLNSDGLAEIESGKAELSAKIAEVRSGISSLGGTVSSGTGSLPVVNVGRMKGVDVTIDFNQYAGSLQVISGIILALAWLSAFSIILSR